MHANMFFFKTIKIKSTIIKLIAYHVKRGNTILLLLKFHINLSLKSVTHTNCSCSYNPAFVGINNDKNKNYFLFLK